MRSFAIGGGHSPIKFTLEVNGDTTPLVQVRIGNEYFWAGRPAGTRSTCRFALIFTSSGTIVGSAAVNFIATHGTSSRRKATEEVYMMTRDLLSQGFVHHVTRFYNDVQREMDRAELAEDLAGWLGTGFAVGSVPMTAAEYTELTAVLARLGIPHEVLLIVKSHGLSVSLVSDDVIDRRLSPKFARAETGTWDGESDIIALSAGFTAGEVLLAKESGIRLARPSRPAKKPRVLRITTEAAEAVEVPVQQRLQAQG